MLFQIQSYLRFLWDSKNEHGVHSPFVFSLLTKCFYDKKPKPDYALLSGYRKSLLANKNFIEVCDYGAGSRVFKSNRRQISQIAKTAGISPTRARLLYRIANYFQPQNILEIGTSLGLATSALALGNPKGKITTLEGCPSTLAVAKQQFEQLASQAESSALSTNPLSSRAESRDIFKNIEFVQTRFEDFLNDLQPSELPSAPAQSGDLSTNTLSSRAESRDNRSNNKLQTTNNKQPATYDLIYFDGNHSKEATLEYFELLLPTIHNDSVWIFDDIHWSPEMEEAWEAIKNHPKVKVTIDTYQWGLVFFRYEQEKEHFVIRTFF